MAGRRGKSGVTVAEVREIMQAVAPERLACPGDPVGLQAGRSTAAANRILVALDATRAVIAYAARHRFELIVTHHPRFYSPLGNVCEDRRDGELAAALVRAGISLYCAHTNLDIAPGGVNDVLADLAGMSAARKPVQTTGSDQLIKLVVFVPDSHLEAVRQAVCDMGAGAIGDYTDCSYRVTGKGSFRPGPGAKPYIGTRGMLEEVEEWRLEVILPQSVLPAVESALKAAHPYEEPAYDLIPLLRGEPYGLGRAGALTKPVTLAALARRIKNATACHAAALLGDAKSHVKKVAVWSGAGAKATPVLAALGSFGPGEAALICGEISYHEAEILQERGAGVIVLGHGPSEQAALTILAANLREALPEATVEQSPCLWPDFQSV